MIDVTVLAVVGVGELPLIFLLSPSALSQKQQGKKIRWKEICNLNWFKIHQN
jgi:hypothetical protein